MNDIAARVSDVTATGSELTLLTTENPLVILQDSAKFDAFYERVKQEVEGHVPDLTTDKGRKAIASLAFKVVKTKTALDEAGKKLTEDKRKEITAVDAARKTIRDKLDALRDEVRKPLTEWEAAEEARVARCQQAIAGLKDSAVIRLDDTSEGVAARLAEVEALEITEAEFGDLLEFATDTKALAVEALTTGRDRLAQEEADRAELARLRQEAEERRAREAEEAEAAAAREREAAEARAREEAEATRAAAEEQARQEAEARAEREARERAEAAKRAAEDAAAAAREAAERERIEAEERAAHEQRARDEAHAAEVAELRAAAERAEAARAAEAQRLADEKAAADQRAAAEKAAAEVRAADIAHRGAIMRAAKEAIIEHGVVEEAEAKAIVLAIAAGSVPHVSIRF